MKFKHSLTLYLSLLLINFGTSALANSKSFSSVNGIPATGPNEFCGEPLWSFEDQGVSPLSFRQVGIHNTQGSTPGILTAQNCIGSQPLATIHDPVLSTDPPGPAPAIVQKPDPRLENIPLREVPRTVGIARGGTDGRRATLGDAGTAPANPFPVFLSQPAEPITLQDWASARGRMFYRCSDDGTSFLTGQFRNLIGNGVYSVWGIFRTTLPSGAVVSLPVPLGGIPNAVVPNDRGQARFSRRLPFCPDNETADGSLLLWVAVAYHSDSALYGGVPDQADLVTRFIDQDGTEFESPLSLLVHHEHLVFPINITSTNDRVRPLIFRSRFNY